MRRRATMGGRPGLRDSEVNCGLNDALCLVQMERDSGVSNYKKSSKNAGVKYEKLCPDEATCSRQCVVECADKECEGTYGAKVKGSEPALQFIIEGPRTTNVGDPREHDAPPRGGILFKSRALQSLLLLGQLRNLDNFRCP